MHTYELARRYGLTVEGAVTWAFEFEDQPAFAGFRELATNGINKPVINVFRMMGMLGGGKPGAHWVAAESSGALPIDNILAGGVTDAADVNAAATRNGKEVDVLVWNYHDVDVPAQAAAVTVAIDGLRGKTVDAEQFRMDATHSNAYRLWGQMGSPAHPDAEQTRKLERAGRLEQSQPNRSIPVVNGTATIAIDLPRQGVALIRIRER
jgi:xylan 1,4-beta-xylosidase